MFQNVYVEGLGKKYANLGYLYENLDLDFLT